MKPSRQAKVYGRIPDLKNVKKILVVTVTGFRVIIPKIMHWSEWNAFLSLETFKVSFFQQKSNTKSPWTPTTHRKMKFYTPMYGAHTPYKSRKRRFPWVTTNRKNKVLPPSKLKRGACCLGLSVRPMSQPDGLRVLPQRFPSWTSFRARVTILTD